MYIARVTLQIQFFVTAGDYDGHDLFFFRKWVKTLKLLNQLKLSVYGTIKLTEIHLFNISLCITSNESSQHYCFTLELFQGFIYYNEI